MVKFHGYQDIRSTILLNLNGHQQGQAGTEELYQKNLNRKKVKHF